MTRILLLFLLCCGATSAAWADPPSLVCDGVADDTAALQHLFATSALIALPVGECVVTATLTNDKKALKLVGHGPDLSRIRWTGIVSIGIVSEASSAFEQSVTISDVSLIASGRSNLALGLGWPPDVWSGFLPTARITNVVIRGDLFAPSSGWENGIILRDAWGAVIDYVNIQGPYPVTFNAFTMHGAIHLTGRTIGAFISNSSTNWSNFGVLAMGETEGLVIENSAFMGNRWGIYDTSYPDKRPGLTIRHTHTASIHGGIILQNRVQALLDGNLLYQWSGPVEGPFTGITLNAGTEATRVLNNYILGRLDNPQGVGIAVLAGAARNTLTGNQSELTVFGKIVNHGTSTIMSGNR